MPRQLSVAIAFLVHSQLMMALSAVAILYASTRVLVAPLSGWWYLAAGLGTWTIYLLDSARSRNAEDQRSQPERAELFQRLPALRLLLPLLTATVGAMAVLLAEPTAGAIWLLLVLGALGFAYVLPILPIAHGARATLKHFALLKPITICIAWTLGAVLLPTLASVGEPSFNATLTLGLLLLALLLGDTLLLDLRDREGDLDAGIKTFAVKAGHPATHTAVALCLAFAALLILLGAPSALEPELWRRVSLAGVLGLTTAWLGWRVIRSNEAATALGLMAWRFLAALAAL